MYEHNALGYWSGLALCLTKVRSSRARCPATALILLSCSTRFFNSKTLSLKYQPLSMQYLIHTVGVIGGSGFIRCDRALVSLSW